jgi:hypothetical protein
MKIKEVMRDILLVYLCHLLELCVLFPAMALLEEKEAMIRLRYWQIIMQNYTSWNLRSY